MNLVRRGALLALCLVLPWAGESVERVEIVVDNSAAMWRTLGQGPPRFVGVRDALLHYAASSLLRQGRPEIGLRNIGGRSDQSQDEICDDTDLVLPFALVEPEPWFEALSTLVPRGGRPLAAALRAAAADLADAPDRRRLVLVVAGGTDDCGGDVTGALEAITAADPAIDLRVVGLGLDRDTANAATQLAPTRNLFDTAALGATLEWALQPADTRPAVPVQFEIRMDLNGTPANRSDLVLSGPAGQEPVQVLVRNGSGRARVVPGRYSATVAGVGVTHRLAGLVVGAPSGRLDLDLAVGPPVSLAFEPQRPVAGGVAFVQVLGAPAAGGWLAVSTPETPVGGFVLRVPVRGGDQNVELPLPDFPQELELRFLYEAAPGVLQEFGRVPLETDRPVVRIESPDKVEIRAPMTIGWNGPGNPGDTITVVPGSGGPGERVICMPVDVPVGTVTILAPVIPGKHTINYVSSWGQVLERFPVEIFEVLATVEAPQQVAPADDVSVTWTGPDDADDFLSIASDTAASEDYISWIPTSSGSPARLAAPASVGIYEIRYVRGLDGQVLARRRLEVVASDLRIGSPRAADAGTRFEVTWRGTAGPGDFVAVARVDADVSDWLDFAYVAEGHSLTLAAPFEPGTYEVRYISGTGLEILAKAPLRVR